MTGSRICLVAVGLSFAVDAVAEVPLDLRQIFQKSNRDSMLVHCNEAQAYKLRVDKADAMLRVAERRMRRRYPDPMLYSDIAESLGSDVRPTLSDSAVMCDTEYQGEASVVAYESDVRMLHDRLQHGAGVQ